MMDLIVLIYCVIMVIVFAVSVIAFAVAATDKKDMYFDVFLSVMFALFWPMMSVFGLIMLTGKMLYLFVLNRNK